MWVDQTEQEIKNHLSFLEPTTYQEFRGEGSINELGGHDVQLETTGENLRGGDSFNKIALFRPTTSSCRPRSVRPSWSINCSSLTNKIIV